MSMACVAGCASDCVLIHDVYLAHVYAIKEAGLRERRIADMELAERLAHEEAATRQILTSKQRQISDHWDRAVRAERELAEFRRKVAERMMQEARDRDWCGEFERIMEEFDLEEFMVKDHEVRVEFTVTVAGNWRDGPDSGDVDEAAINYIRQQMMSSDWEVTED